jgi:hypothetical protein
MQFLSCSPACRKRFCNGAATRNSWAKPIFRCCARCCAKKPVFCWPDRDTAALLPALTPQAVSSRATEPAMRSGFYGYGFNVGTTSAARTELSHSGAFELGAGTNVLMLPSADVGIVALTNGTLSGVPEALTAQLAALVQFG